MLHALALALALPLPLQLALNRLWAARPARRLARRQAASTTGPPVAAAARAARQWGRQAGQVMPFPLASSRSSVLVGAAQRDAELQQAQLQPGGAGRGGDAALVARPPGEPGLAAGSLEGRDAGRFDRPVAVREGRRTQV
jgi:hypothetical protein